MSRKTEENPVSSLKSIEEIKSDFESMLRSTGDVGLTPRLEACIPEIKSRIRSVQGMNPRKNRLEYERVVRALQKFVGHFCYEISSRTKNSVSLNRSSARIAGHGVQPASAFPEVSPKLQGKKKQTKSSHGRVRGFFDDE